MVNFYQYNGSIYRLTTAVAWQQAQAQARSLGGNLVTINNQAEQDWLVSTFGSSEWLWTGLTDEVTEGQFKWVSGETSTYTNWSPGEPNNSWNEDYVHIGSNNGKWNDLPSTVSLRGIIENKFFEYNGSKYLLTGPGTWQQAQAQAQSLGGNLVTVNNQAEQDWLVSTFGSSEWLWTGLTDEVTEGQFKWVNGETFTYTNWAPGQPDNYWNNEDYVGMNYSAAGKWNDYPSTSSQRGIIEIKNTINGGDGNDTLNGNGDVYTLIGGKGDDTYIVDSTTDAVIENANEGTDTIQSSVTLTLATNVENLTLTGTAAINGTGNAGNNVIIGNSANNILNGGVGDDILNPVYSQGSTDTVDGGDGNDLLQVDYSNKTSASVGIDLGFQNNNVIYHRAGSVGDNFELVKFSNIERFDITGTQYDDVFKGRSGNDTFNGGAGNDFLDGGDGNDILNGGAGTDTLIGGLGDDIYIVDSTTDTITENANEGTDTIQSSVTYIITAANVENLTLTGTAVINGTGNELNNFITGNDVNNILDGGAGNDILNGAAGTDILIGGLGNDIYIVDSTTDIITELANGGTDIIQSSVTYTIAALANVENLTLTGTAVINGTGNAANNVITGNGANNSLNGGAGNDILIGGLGKDILTGGLGVDRFDYRTLADSVFSNFDVITGFNATTGNDLFLVTTARSGFSNAGSVATLNTAGITARLTNTVFTANSAAQFTFGSRSFVAINDATAGFSATTDAIIEVTGLTGTLTVNNFTTTLV